MTTAYPCFVTDITHSIIDNNNKYKVVYKIFYVSGNYQIYDQIYGFTEKPDFKVLEKLTSLNGITDYFSHELQ
jgi:hypothetical protein